MMSLKYVVAPNLFLVIWCLASKHARENAKMVNKREKKWNVLGISRTWRWSLA